MPDWLFYALLAAPMLAIAIGEVVAVIGGDDFDLDASREGQR